MKNPQYQLVRADKITRFLQSMYLNDNYQPRVQTAEDVKKQFVRLCNYSWCLGISQNKHEKIEAIIIYNCKAQWLILPLCLCARRGI